LPSPDSRPGCFVSKDQILAKPLPALTAEKSFGDWCNHAGLTSFYMFRLWFMTFFGEYKPDADLGDAHLIQAAPAPHGSTSHDDSHADDDHGHGHGGVHESPWIMLARW